MDIKASAQKFVDELLSDETHERPSDEGKVEDLEMKLPDWFDEKKFNQGRRFYKDFIFTLTASMVLGLVAIFSVPSILKVLIGTRRSNSVYTAYKRYISTNLHIVSWFDHELRPGSVSWRSLHTVRSRHLQASRSSKLKGQGIVSQRDLALTLFGFIGFSFLKPDKFGITQLESGDWDAYTFTWKTIGHMIGLQDRYNICRDNFEETREVCRLILKRVFTPCLENVPEYFEHMTYVMVKGSSNLISTLEASSMIHAVKHLADVPGYIYTEEDRLKLQEALRSRLKGRSVDTGIDAAELIETCAIDGLPKRKPNLLYLRDYDTVETSPAYKSLPAAGKFKLAFNNAFVGIYATYIGRVCVNFYMRWILFFATYLPYMAMWRYGIKKAFIYMFKEDPVDDEVPKPNSEYNKPKPPEPWYKVLYEIMWY